jgi:hypothetical protein
VRACEGRLGNAAQGWNQPLSPQTSGQFNEMDQSRSNAFCADAKEICPSRAERVFPSRSTTTGAPLAPTRIWHYAAAIFLLDAQSNLDMFM